MSKNGVSKTLHILDWISSYGTVGVMYSQIQRELWGMSNKGLPAQLYMPRGYWSTQLNKLLRVYCVKSADGKRWCRNLAVQCGNHPWAHPDLTRADRVGVKKPNVEVSCDRDIVPAYDQLDIDVAHFLPDPVKESPTMGYTGTMENTSTKKIVGYHVRVVWMTNDYYVAANNAGVWRTIQPQEPITHAAAYKRAASYLELYGDHTEGSPEIVPVYHTPTPIENAAHELGGLFESLCQRHNLNLGLTREQVDAMLVKDLEAIKDLKSFGAVMAGIPNKR